MSSALQAGLVARGAAASFSIRKIHLAYALTTLFSPGAAGVDFLGLPLAPQASIFLAFGARLITRGPRSNRVSHSVPPDPKARTKAPRVSSSYVASSLRFVVSNRRSNRRSGRHRSPAARRRRSTGRPTHRRNMLERL